MKTPEHINFPPLPRRLTEEYGVGALRMRVFGTDERDVEVDLVRGFRDEQAVEVLSACTSAETGAAVPPRLFRAMTVGLRAEALVALAMHGGARPIPLMLSCANQSCSEAIETQISLADIREMHESHRLHEEIAAVINGSSVRLRKPTGDDQLAWRGGSYRNRGSAAHAVVRALIIDGTVPDSAEQIEAIGAILDNGDPLIDASITVSCPACGAETRSAFDLEERALWMLRCDQELLLRTVHRLARVYHWSERSIALMPQWRRDFYLRCIEGEAQR